MKNKKNNYSIFFIILILMFGFYIYSSNQSKGSRQSEDNIKSTQETKSNSVGSLDKQTIFENKQKCATYKDEIDKKMASTQWSRYIVEDIFYSDEENSCMFSVVGYQEKSAFLGESYVAYMIWDYLTDTLVFYRDSTLTDGLDLADMHKNAVEYLQGQESLRYQKDQWYLN